MPATSLSVEVDVKQDAWDPDGNHVALNVGGSVVSTTVFDTYISLTDGKLKKLILEFIPQLGRLRVYMIPDAEASSSPLYQIGSVVLDICSVLPVAQTAGAVYYGITGATGSIPTQTVVTSFTGYGESTSFNDCGD